jgi:hypothetical protein
MQKIFPNKIMITNIEPFWKIAESRGMKNVDRTETVVLDPQIAQFDFIYGFFYFIQRLDILRMGKYEEVKLIKASLGIEISTDMHDELHTTIILGGIKDEDDFNLLIERVLGFKPNWTIDYHHLMLMAYSEMIEFEAELDGWLKVESWKLPLNLR